jgi:hypothetical protein
MKKQMRSSGLFIRLILILKQQLEAIKLRNISQIEK